MLTSFTPPSHSFLSVLPHSVLMGVLVTPRRDLLAKLRFYQNASGAVPSAFDCWLAQRGAKTLALRMQQHGTSALALARWLAKQSWVTETIYPGLEGKERDLTRRLAWKQLSSVARERLVDQGYTEEGGFPYGGWVSRCWRRWSIARIRSVAGFCG